MKKITWQDVYRLLFSCAIVLMSHESVFAAEEVGTLVFEPPGDARGHVVLVAGDEEYRSEESMPMLGKILSQRHGYRCTIVFSLSADGTYIDPNNQSGLRGLAALDSADLMIIGTRFRRPDELQAAHLAKFLNAGKPVIGIRTATHAFNGAGNFGDNVSFDEFGLKVLGEQWVNHHGEHKVQGARGVLEAENAKHPILNSVEDVFAPSDVYGVVHLTEQDQVLMRGAVTESLNPNSKTITGAKNDPMQPLAWLHTYQVDSGQPGHSFCTTAGASVDFVNEDLRRMIVNAVYHLTEQKVPDAANVDFVDPFYPTFYGFINDKVFWKNADLQPVDFRLGNSPSLLDPPGSPEWPFRPTAK